MESNLQSIKQQFYLLRNGVIADVIRKSGLGYEMCFGLNLPQLKEVAASLVPSKSLAQELWADRRCRESLLLAPMVWPKAEVSSEEATELLATSPNTEVTDILCHSLLRFLPDPLSISEKALLGNEMSRYGAVRLAFNALGSDLERASSIARKELERNSTLTSSLCKKLLDEADFLKSDNI